MTITSHSSFGSQLETQLVFCPHLGCAEGVAVLGLKKPNEPAAYHTISLSQLDVGTAEGLNIWAQLSPHMRNELLPALRHALDVQHAEATVANEEAAPT